MARASGHEPAPFIASWRAFGLQPHRSESFKLSERSLLRGKVRDIVLYLAAARIGPHGSRGEKEPDPARTVPSPSSPMRPRQAERRSTTTSATARHCLFALASTSNGISSFPRHRAREFRKFLDEVEANSLRTSRHGQLSIPGPTRPRRRDNETAAAGICSEHAAPPGSTASSDGRSLLDREERGAGRPIAVERTISRPAVVTNQPQEPLQIGPNPPHPRLPSSGSACRTSNRKSRENHANFGIRRQGPDRS